MFIDFADGDDCKPSSLFAALLKTLRTQNAASKAKTLMGRVLSKIYRFSSTISTAFGRPIPSARAQDLLDVTLVCDGDSKV